MNKQRTVNNSDILYSSPESAVDVHSGYFLLFFIMDSDLKFQLSQGIRYKVSYALSFFIVIFIV